MGTETKATIGVALVHLLGRGALLATALAADDGQYRIAVAAGLALPVILLAERAAASFLRATIEGDLTTGALRSLLGSRSILAVSSAEQATLVTGAFDESHTRAETIPAAGGDVAACMLVVGVATVRHETARLAWLIGVSLLAVVAALALRARVARASIVAWRTHREHLQRVLVGLEGAAQLVAAGRSRAFETEVARGLQRLRAASRWLALESAAVGRAPLVAAGVVALVLFAALGSESVAPRNGFEWGVLGSMLAPFFGLAAAAASLAQTSEPRRALREVLALPPRPTGTRSLDLKSEVELSGLSVRFGVREVLSIDNVAFRRGVNVLTGKNGSGKSTLLHVLAGLVPAGENATADGVPFDHVDWEVTRKQMSMLFQRPFLPTGASVRETMQMMLGDRNDAVLRDALRRLDALHVLEEKSEADPLSCAVEELSAGERQRIAIAIALARDVDLYLLDEPDANLDRDAVAALVELMRVIGARATIIVAAHGRELISVAEQHIQLEAGRVANARSGANAVRAS